MNWLDWIAIAVVVLLELATMMVFLYQRTVRKLALRMGLDQRVLVFLYPQYMLRMYQLSFLKWPLYIYLLFVNWGVATGIFVASFVLSMIMPVVDWRHLLTMRKMLILNYNGLSPDGYEAILSVMDHCIAQTDHPIYELPDYKRVIDEIVEYGDFPDSMIAISLVADNSSNGKPKIFDDLQQARIHVAHIRNLLKEAGYSFKSRP